MSLQCEYFRTFWVLLDSLRSFRYRITDCLMLGRLGITRWLATSELVLWMSAGTGCRMVLSRCKACTLNSCTDRSRAVMSSVRVISWRGRKYLMRGCPSTKSTPHRLGLNEVRRQFLAKWIASWMTCLCSSLKVSRLIASKAFSRTKGTQSQQIVYPSSSISQMLRMLITFRWQRVFSTPSLSSNTRLTLPVLQQTRFRTRTLLLPSRPPPSCSRCSPKGNWLPAISIVKGVLRLGWLDLLGILQLLDNQLQFEQSRS